MLAQVFDPTVYWCNLFTGMEGSNVGHVRHGGAKTTRAIRAAIKLSQASLAQFSRELSINPKTVAEAGDGRKHEDWANGTEFNCSE